MQIMDLCIKSSLCQPVLLAQLTGQHALQHDLQGARSKLSEVQRDLSHTKAQLDALQEQHTLAVAKAAADGKAQVSVCSGVCAGLPAAADRPADPRPQQHDRPGPHAADSPLTA